MTYFYTLVLLLLSTLGILSSCQDYNSNSFDQNKYLSTDLNDPFGILRAKCISCHKGTHNWWSNLTQNSDWSGTQVDGSYYVVPGDFSGSYIISRLKNYGSDMPDGGSALSEDELDVLRDWIENGVF